MDAQTSAELDRAPLARSGGLLGRDRELGELYGLIDGIDLGGWVMVVRGEAGIGKTALLETASVRALQRGAAVTRAIASESESPLAFAGLHQLLKPYLSRLGELPEALVSPAICVKILTCRELISTPQLVTR